MKQQVVNAFRRHAARALKELGFVGPRGHFVRRGDEVTHVIELQHSIYGGRVTANLGVDLEWLRPQVRWIPEPVIGPHAHDATRWVRIGIVSPAKADVWWSYEDEEDSLDEAARNLATAIFRYGLRWMDEQSTRQAFIGYAEEKLVRSRSRERPHGSFLELRLMSAVCAWCGETEQANDYKHYASELWREEKTRLENARQVYKKRHTSEPRIPGVPNLLEELEALIAPTTGARVFSPPPRAGSRRRSKSSR